MNKYFKLICFSFIIISCGYGDDNESDNNNGNNSISLFSTKARVVGYLPYYRFSLNNQIEYCKLTHLNLAFANPQSDGTIIFPSSGNNSLSDIINRAKSQNNNIQIYISLAGGALSEEVANTWKKYLVSSVDRNILIDKIIEFVLDNNLDGVDVDLEWEAVTVGYNDFIISLKQKLNIHSKGLTAAFPSETKYSLVSLDALNAFDFVNIMAYDYTGPWNASSPGQHSSLNHSKRGLNYWKDNIGLAPEKLTLGVPFYGWDFQNSNTVKAFTYGSMVETNYNYADLDNVGNMFYNGRPTIINKVQLAAQNISGIMIWELGQDSFTDYSLLQTIHKSYTDFGVETTNLCGN